MKAKGKAGILVFGLVLISSGLFFAGLKCGFADRFFEYLLNRNTSDFFAGSVRLTGLRLNRNFHFFLERFEGALVTQEGSVPLQIGPIQSEGPVWQVLSPAGILLNFEGLRPSNSLNDGLQGMCRMRMGRNGFFELKARIAYLDLEDIAGLNAEVLKGARGEMKGEITIRTEAFQEPRMAADIHIAKPGGKLQSRFFDGLTPYLPQARSRQELKKLASETDLVHFENADLRLELVQSDLIKVFLHILIPDYNLNLNVKMEIRVDEKDALLELARIMGFVRIKVKS